MTKYSGQSPIGEGITFGGVRYQPNLSSFDSPKKITHPGGSGIPLSGQSSYAHRRRTSPNYGVSKGVYQSILSFYEDHRNWDNLGLFPRPFRVLGYHLAIRSIPLQSIRIWVAENSRWLGWLLFFLLKSVCFFTRHNMIIPLWRVLLSYVMTFLLFHASCACISYEFPGPP